MYDTWLDSSHSSCLTSEDARFFSLWVQQLDLHWSISCCNIDQTDIFLKSNLFDCKANGFYPFVNLDGDKTRNWNERSASGGSTTIGRKTIGRTTVGRSQLGATTIGREDNWSYAELVEKS